MRTALTILVPFLAPIALYAFFAWLSASKQAKLEGGEPLQAWQTWPWPKLIAAGVVLSAITFVTLALWRGPNSEKIYVPPHMENGKLVPGQFVDPEDAPKGGKTFSGNQKKPITGPSTN